MRNICYFFSALLCAGMGVWRLVWNMFDKDDLLCIQYAQNVVVFSFPYLIRLERECLTYVSLQ